MKIVYILDACALIAALTNEEGADIVKSIFEKEADNEADIYMNKINLLEVYYNICRQYGIIAADNLLKEIEKSPVIIKANLADDVFREAGKLKATYKISLADSIALAEASVSGGALVTSDHHEFDIIEKSEDIKFLWIR
ncbi:MAG: PIN domain-containing protein [Oscillospiraceae bacterium]|nr:PIN domain-containing protein [Oscillospiraceae bacterium]